MAVIAALQDALGPDGTLLMWTASRGDGGGRGPASQLWVSRLDLAAVEKALDAAAAHAPTGGSP